MIYNTWEEHTNHYTTDEPTLVSIVVDRGFISGIMVSVLTSSVVDRGFISGVMVSVLVSSVVDRGSISGVMISVLPH
jgi:F0F1-type ATP synthase assembly protein I